VGTVKSRILRGRRALRQVLEPLLGDQELHAPSHSAAPKSAHASIVEPQPSPFGDAYTAARRVNDFSQGDFSQGDFSQGDSSLEQSNSLRANTTGEGLP